MTSVRPGTSRVLAPGPRRPRPHGFANDPAAPGTCVICHLIKKNAAHDDAAVAAELAAADDAQAEERRRLGEREED